MMIIYVFIYLHTFEYIVLLILKQYFLIMSLYINLNLCKTFLYDMGKTALAAVNPTDQIVLFWVVLNHVSMDYNLYTGSWICNSQCNICGQDSLCILAFLPKLVVLAVDANSIFYSSSSSSFVALVWNDILLLIEKIKRFEFDFYLSFSRPQRICQRVLVSTSRTTI